SVRIMRLGRDRSVEREERRREIALWRKSLNDEADRQGLARIDWDETREEFAAAYPGNRGLRLFRRRVAGMGSVEAFPQLSANIEYWLPAKFGTTFKASDRQGRSTVFGSIFSLLEDLDRFNQATWRAPQAMISDWNDAGRPGSSGSPDRAVE